jgi:uncharacterized membrane protein YciS (DUF1049 family)
MQTLRRALTAAGSIALALAIVLFSTQETNRQAVDVHYLFGTTQVALWQLLGGAFLAGCLAAWLLTVLPWTRAKLSARRHRKRAERLESELHQLRNLPLSRDENAATTSGLAEGGAGTTGSG